MTERRPNSINQKRKQISYGLIDYYSYFIPALIDGLEKRVNPQGLYVTFGASLIVFLFFTISLFTVYAENEFTNQTSLTPGLNDKFDLRFDILPMFPFSDLDGDRISNVWEKYGIYINQGDNILDLDLPALGANPLHKDIFVEVDYMQFHRPNNESIHDVIKAFANAPLKNPDGIKGITLHVQVDEQITHKNLIDYDGMKSTKKAFFGKKTERADSNHINIIKAKQQVFHYSLFAHQRPGTSSSGLAEWPGMNSLITLGATGWGKDPVTGHNVGSKDQQEGTFMHELGHNLGSSHGGLDDINYKPNYLSVMNYAFQFKSVYILRPLDYSHCAITTINENSLKESAGIGQSCPPNMVAFVCSPEPNLLTFTAKPVDWNRDRDTKDIVSISVNCDKPRQKLNGYDDWNKLIYISLRNIPINDTETERVITEEITVEDLREHRLFLLNEIYNVIAKINFDNLANIEPIPNLNTSQSSWTNLTREEIENLLINDKLDDAITVLDILYEDLRLSLPGDRSKDSIGSVIPENRVLSLIDNLIGSLESQK